jgi:hypothetical protein
MHNLLLTGRKAVLDGPTKAVSRKPVLQFQPQTRSWNSGLDIQWGGGCESGSAAELVDPQRGEGGCMQPRCWADSMAQSRRESKVMVGRSSAGSESNQVDAVQCGFHAALFLGLESCLPIRTELTEAQSLANDSTRFD